MIGLMRFLSLVVNIYMMVIFVRVILTWFSWERNSAFMSFLCSITDPYLNWFRRFPFLKTGYIDFSPIAALGILSLVNRVFAILATYGTISLGVILALILQLFWGVISFMLGFSIVILVLRLIALYAARNSSGSFWRIIEGLSQPVIYRVNRLLFKNRVVNFKTGLFISIGCLAGIYIILRILVVLVSGMLAKMPI